MKTMFKTTFSKKSQSWQESKEFTEAKNNVKEENLGGRWALRLALAKTKPRSVFFCEVGSPVQPREDSEERLRAGQLIVHTGPGDGGLCTPAGPCGEVGWSGGRGRFRPDRAFPGISKGKAGQGRLNSLGLAGWNGFTGLCLGNSLVPGYLAPGPRKMKAEGFAPWPAQLPAH